MQNGMIEINNASLWVWDRKVFAGMSYDYLCREFAEYIKVNNLFVNSKGQKCSYVRLDNAIVYDRAAEIEAFFLDGVAYKVSINIDASTTYIESTSTGIKLYQEKVMQTAKELRKVITEQYGECKGLDYLFSYSQNGYKIYSTVDRECMHCSIVIEVNEYEQ